MNHLELEKCKSYIVSYNSLKTIASKLDCHVADAYGRIYIISNKYKNNLHKILETEGDYGNEREYGVIALNSLDEMKIFLSGVAVSKNKILEKKYDGKYALVPIKQYKPVKAAK